MNNKIKDLKYFTSLLIVCFIISCGNKKTEPATTTEAKTEVAPKEEAHEEHAEGEVALDFGAIQSCTNRNRHYRNA
jgi:hypothetical protein